MAMGKQVITVALQHGNQWRHDYDKYSTAEIDIPFASFFIHSLLVFRCGLGLFKRRRPQWGPRCNLYMVLAWWPRHQECELVSTKLLHRGKMRKSANAALTVDVETLPLSAMLAAADDPWWHWWHWVVVIIWQICGSLSHFIRMAIMCFTTPRRWIPFIVPGRRFYPRWWWWWRSNFAPTGNYYQTFHFWCAEKRGQLMSSWSVLGI